jgi:hypothetical protein
MLNSDLNKDADPLKPFGLHGSRIYANHIIAGKRVDGRIPLK